MFHISFIFCYFVLRSLCVPPGTPSCTVTPMPVTGLGPGIFFCSLITPTKATISSSRYQIDPARHIQALRTSGDALATGIIEVCEFTFTVPAKGSNGDQG
ncbi:hypothetical protein P389DRAFT_82220 [Cystobasidium minutum MCA 4210]|uniref:uncharacterized protein n=1 Tax=Cystobasidium minutum MCA 4210 TaxID=1397322 RepID=UPI0034CF4F2F|eukprot:jgi/Rhomi1/82220/CE82219_213